MTEVLFAKKTDTDALSTAVTTINTTMFPERTRPVLAVVGHSIVSASKDSDSATSEYDTPRGVQYWFRAETGIYSDKSLNFGVAGDTIDMVLARMGPILAANADIYYLDIGTNDGIGTSNFSSKQTLMISLINQLKSQGAIVIVQAISAKQTGTGATQRSTARWNEWLRGYVLTTQRVYFADVNQEFGDPVDSQMSPRTYLGALVTYDILHPKNQGGYFLSRAGVRIINTLFPPAQGVFANVTDVYNATENPNGNLLTNGILSGTAGTVTPATSLMTGTAPDSWTLTAADNGGDITALTVVGSQSPDLYGFPGAAIDLGGIFTGATSGTINSGAQVVLRQDVAGNVSNGDILKGSIDVCYSGFTNISSIALEIVFTVGGVNYLATTGGTNTGDLFPGNGFFHLETPKLTIPASGSITLRRYALRLWLKSTGTNNPATGRVVAYRAKMQKVT